MNRVGVTPQMLDELRTRIGTTLADLQTPSEDGGDFRQWFAQRRAETAPPPSGGGGLGDDLRSELAHGIANLLLRSAGEIPQQALKAEETARNTAFGLGMAKYQAGREDAKAAADRAQALTLQGNELSAQDRREQERIAANADLHAAEIRKAEAEGKHAEFAFRKEQETEAAGKAAGAIGVPSAEQAPAYQAAVGSDAQPGILRQKALDLLEKHDQSFVSPGLGVPVAPRAATLVGEFGRLMDQARTVFPGGAGEAAARELGELLTKRLHEFRPTNPADRAALAEVIKRHKENQFGQGQAGVTTEEMLGQPWSPGSLKDPRWPEEDHGFLPRFRR